jgi:hypothetical protein
MHCEQVIHMSTLHGRLTKLEAALPVGSAGDVCVRCGLPHVPTPTPVSMAEAIVRHAFGVTAIAPPPLCLCVPCCADGQVIARLTHGLSPWEDRACPA